MATNILLIHDAVKDYDIFIRSCNADTIPIIVSSKDTSVTFATKLAIILATVSLTNIQAVGLVFDNTGKRAPYMEYTEDELLPTKVTEVAEPQINTSLSTKSHPIIEPHLTMDDDVPNIIPEFPYSGKMFSDMFLQVLKTLKTGHPTFEILDLITCNITPNVTQFSELLDAGITVRYSTNFTGNNGDWILEVPNSINIKDDYFNGNIVNYKYLLGIGSVPPTITTASDLYDLMRSTVPSDMSGSYKLGADIDMTTMPTHYYSESIGKSSTPFIGNFDGSGHTITIRDVSGNNYFGLFGFVGNSTITTTVIKNVTIRYTQDITINSSTVTNFGGICGYNLANTIQDNTVIYNSGVKITIVNTGPGALGPIRHGGCIGYNIGIDISKPANCIRNTIILHDSVEFSSNSINYISVLGGIVGINKTYANMSGCLLEGGNNIKLQSVNSSNDPVRNVFVGGVLGTNEFDSVCNNNSVHYGDNISIICDSSNICIMGGNIGYTYTGIANNNTITFGNVTFTGNSQTNYCYIGGHIGNTYTGISNNNHITFGNIVFIGNSYTDCFVGGSFGLIITSASNNNTITFGNVTCTGHSTNGSYYNGGYIGYIYGSTSNTNHITFGNVTCTVDASNNCYVGGNIGYHNTNSTFTDNIIGFGNVTFTGTSINSECYLGGNIGNNENSTSNNNGITFGNVIFTGNSRIGCNLGGNIGYNNTGTANTNIITFSNVTFTGNSSSGYCYLGGNIGSNYNTSTSNNNHITCGNVTFTGNSLYDCHLGGNIGQNYYKNSISSTNTITFGNVTFTGNSTSGICMLGGNIGQNNMSISNTNHITCGNVTFTGASINSGCYLGGNIGYNIDASDCSNNITFNNVTFTGNSTVDRCILGGNIGGNNTSTSNNNSVMFGDNVTFTGHSIGNICCVGGNIGINLVTGISDSNIITFGNYISFTVYSLQDGCFIGGNIGYNYNTSTSINDKITFGDNINIISKSSVSDNIGGIVGFNQGSILSNSIVTYGKYIRMENINAIIGPTPDYVVIGNICGGTYGNNTITNNNAIINDNLTVKANSGSSGVSINSYIGYIDIGINTITGNSVKFNDAILQYTTYPATIPLGIIYNSIQYPIGSRIVTSNFNINVDDITIYVYIVNDVPTCCIVNNQASNNYLHDESGRTEKRENALLTSGYYRGPVDSSTLTRIRQGRGVLLNQPGVSGAMQGSRCCP